MDAEDAVAWEDKGTLIALSSELKDDLAKLVSLHVYINWSDVKDFLLSDPAIVAKAIRCATRSYEP